MTAIAQVRAARRDDDAAIRMLYLQVDALHRPAEEAETAPRGLGPGAVARAIAESTSGLFVAEAEGAVIGFVLVRLYEARDRRFGRYGYVEALGVDAAHRRRGVGRELMRRAEAWVTEAGISHLALDVHGFNEAARAFYERLGYRPALTRMSRALPPAASDGRP